MNIYLVIESQFPETDMIMICECASEDQAKLAYLRLWFPVDSNGDNLSVTFLAFGTREQPALLWKNFQTPQDIENAPQTKKIEDGTN